MDQALSSGNEEFVRRVVDGMFWHTVVADGTYERHLERQRSEPLPKRAFHRVPNLKGYLKDYSRDGFRKDGYGVELLDSDGRPKVSPGIAGSMLLASLFPNDPEVHDFIFEVHDKEHSATSLRLLSLGGFQTARANELRIECLNSQRTEAALAATALGEFQTPDGLAALGKALRVDHPAVHRVAKSLMAYERDSRLESSLRAFAEIAANYPEKSHVGQAGATIRASLHGE